MTRVLHQQTIVDCFELYRMYSIYIVQFTFLKINGGTRKSFVIICGLQTIEVSQ